jgi:hypothetical protein
MEERSSLFKQKGKRREIDICSLSAQEAPAPPVRCVVQDLTKPPCLILMHVNTKCHLILVAMQA